MTDFADLERAARRVRELVIRATHVASGHSVVFTQRSAAPLPAWRSRRMPVAHACDITLDHALASAAVRSG